MKNGSSSPLLSKKEWIPDSQRRKCSLCDVKFSFSTRKHHCRFCGEVVLREVFEETRQDGGTPRRICNSCLRKSFLQSDQQKRMLRSLYLLNNQMIKDSQTTTSRKTFAPRESRRNFRKKQETLPGRIHMDIEVE